MSDGEIFSCGAPYGQGGLGRHLSQIVCEARLEGRLAGYFATAVPDGDSDGTIVQPFGQQILSRYTPIRFSAAWTMLFGCAMFDRSVAARLRNGTVFHGFVSMSLYSFQRARQLKYKWLEYEAASAHVGTVRRQMDLAHRAFPIEASPFNSAYMRRAEQEYELADVIWVSSEYAHQSFLAEGIAESKLKRRLLTIPERFKPLESRSSDGVFRVVYVGSVTPGKGVPVLLEAFHRLAGDAELTLVGGTGSRAMRRFIVGWMARDPRIRMAPGDPLLHLQRADVCVHPSYQDGFGYAPMEALACGVPVIVTEDTGMKEHVVEGVNGYVVPTGEWEAILDKLETVRTKIAHRSSRL